MGDRCGDLGKHPGGHGVEGETGDTSRGLMLSEPVEKRGEHREGERIQRRREAWKAEGGIGTCPGDGDYGGTGFYSAGGFGSPGG